MRLKIRKTVWQIMAWWRSRQEPARIVDLQEQIAEAVRQHRPRRRLYDELRRERTARFRQQFGKVAKDAAEQAAVLAMFAIGAALYTVTNGLPVFS